MASGGLWLKSPGVHFQPVPSLRSRLSFQLYTGHLSLSLSPFHSCTAQVAAKHRLFSSPSPFTLFLHSCYSQVPKKLQPLSPSSLPLTFSQTLGERILCILFLKTSPTNPPLSTLLPLFFSITNVIVLCLINPAEPPLPARRNANLNRAPDSLKQLPNFLTLVSNLMLPAPWTLCFSHTRRSILP